MNSNDFPNRGIPVEDEANHVHGDGLPVDHEDMLTVVPVTDEPIEVDDTFSLDKFQVVRREFFSHISEPSITFSNYKIGLNSACIKRLPQIEYIQFLVNRQTRKLAIRPCLESDLHSFQWCTTSGGKRKPRQVTGKIFFMKLFDMMGWNPNYRYKILGKLIRANGEYLFVFDLTATEVYEVIEPDAQQERIRTSQRIGEEYHLAHGTVEKYGAYSKAVDKIAKKDPSMLPRILSGRYKISHENVLALSRMSQQEVKRFGRQMKAMRQSSTVVPYGVSRSQLGQITPEPQVTLQPGIKNMPDFDPDAAIAGLTLTIPSWTSSINRALNSSNMNTVSAKARTNLQQALMNLQATIDELLILIQGAIL